MPQEGHDRLSSAISCVQTGHFMAREILSLENLRLEQNHSRVQIRRAPAEGFPARALFASNG